METLNRPISPEMLKEFESSTSAANAAQMLPPFVYTSEEFFEKVEKPAVFECQWLCVGREAWVPNKGDYFTTSYVGEPLIVVRTRSNEIKCISAVCQHRGNLLVEGSGNCNFFRCPYHHWTYDLNGALAGAPTMDKSVNFDRRDVALPSLKLELWNGFIFVNFDPNAPALKPQLVRFEKDFENYELASAAEPRHDRFLDFPWNWKVIYENTNDGYHANRLHKGPLHDFCPSHLASWPPYRDDDIAVVRYTGFTHIDASFNPSLKVLLPQFPKLTETERTRMVFINIPPTLWVACLSDQIIYFIIHPEGANKCWMDYGIMYSPTSKNDPLFDEKVTVYQETMRHITNQDRHVNTLMQIGLRSRFAARGRTSYQEESSVRFVRWLVGRYQECWPGLEGKDKGPVRIPIREKVSG